MIERTSGAATSGGEMLSGGVSAAAYRALLRNGSFRNLTLATVTSALGDWIGVIAIIALTSDILGPTRAAAFAVSGVMAARLVPALVLAPVAGVFVDRWDRKRVMIATDIGRGMVMALIPFTNEIFTLLLATLLIEVLSSLFAPAKDAVFPTLVRRDQLVAANQVNLLVTYGTLPLGGVLFAGLVGLANTIAPAGSFLADRPVALPIWFNALSFLVSAPLLAGVHIRPVARRTATAAVEAPGAWEELKEGFRFIAGHPVVRTLIIGVMITFVAAGAVISVGELFATVLNAGPSGFGILIAAVGAGLIGGLLAAGPLTARVDKERLFAPGIAVAGAGLVTTALMPTLTLAVPPIVVLGLGAGVSFIVGYTILQERSSDAIRGRAFAAFYSGVRTAVLGATVAAPALVGVLGPERRRVRDLGDVGEILFTPYVLGGVRLTLLAAGTLMLLGSVWSARAFVRALRTPEGLTLAPAPEAGLPVTRPGTLIVFEGGDGAGKSTQIRLLRGAIERAGYDAVVTREPGGTPLGEQVRDLLLTPTGEDIDDRAEALLYAAARAQHVEEVIRPALVKGAVVLCDRYLDSSVVYQGAARGLGEQAVADLNAWATAGLLPDLVVLLDVEPDEGLRRAGDEADPDRLEAAGLDFHREVAAAYRRRVEHDPDRYLKLDATRTVEELHATIRDEVLARLAAIDATRELPTEPAEPVEDGDPR